MKTWCVQRDDVFLQSDPHCCKSSRRWLGDLRIYAVATFSGLADVNAITITVLQSVVAAAKTLV